MLVIKTNEIKNIVLTQIYPPITVHFEADRKFEMNNREYYGLSLCINGQITYRMNGKSFVQTKDTAILLPKGSTYSLTGDKDGIFPVINFDCEGLACSEITVIPIKNPRACIEYYENIKNLYPDSNNRLQVLGLFYMLLNEVFTHPNVKHNLLLAATGFIEENLSCQTLSNKAIADKLNISEVYLRKIFSKHLNKSPKQFILEYRIQKAKFLLTDTAFTVTTIAKKCGFASVYHFSRIFKEKTGVTPTQYISDNTIFKI